MPDAPADLDLDGLLRALLDHEVRFVIAGGVSGNLHGSNTPTLDLDVVYARDPTNLEHLAAALRSIGARLRGAEPGVRFALDSRSLANGMNFTFRTRLGDLDCLGEASRTFSYEKLKTNAEIQDIGDLRVAVASLDDLIRMKRATGRTKDRIELENLLALRDARAKRRG